MRPSTALWVGLLLVVTADVRAEPGPSGDALVSEFVGRLSSLEAVLFDDAADGRLDVLPPFDAALVASGIDDPRSLEPYRKAAATMVESLRAKDLGNDPRERLQTIFDYMHQRVLVGGYKLEATDLRVVLDRGQFNCVSASVLYNYLASECGLSVTGLETPGHAMSRVRVDGQAIDVETTCPGWFRLAHDPKRQAEHVEQTLGAVSGSRGPLREVSPIELAAMIYYNRGVDLLAAKQFANAASANAKALRLDPKSKTARGNLLATINNWAIVEGTLQRYAEADRLLRIGMAIEPSYETFELNFVHVSNQWSLALCMSGRYDDAAAILFDAMRQTPHQAYLTYAAGEVYRRWARSRFDARDYQEAWTRLDEGQKRLAATPGWREAEAREIESWGNALLGRGRVEAALEVFERGLSRLPDSSALAEGRRHAQERLGTQRPRSAGEALRAAARSAQGLTNVADSTPVGW